jgi:hypothetical protein
MLRIRFWDGNKQAQELKKVMSGSAIQERQEKTKRKEPREEKHGELTMKHKTKLSERESGVNKKGTDRTMIGSRVLKMKSFTFISR